MRHAAHEGAVIDEKIRVGRSALLATAAVALGVAGSAVAGNDSSERGKKAGAKLAQIDYSAPAVDAGTRIFKGAGLILTAACGGSTEIQITASTTKQDSSIYASQVATPFDDQNVATDGRESGTFDRDVGFPILVDDLGSPDEGITTFGYYTKDGRTVSGQIATDEVNVAERDPVCEAHGHAMVDSK